MSDKMQKLLDLINDTHLDENHYIYFDKETGEIQQVGTASENEYEFIIVSSDEVKGIMSGKEKMSDYIVFYHALRNDYVFQKKVILKNNEIEYSPFYEVPQRIVSVESDVTDEDILIIQNLKETCWKIKMGYSAANKLLSGLNYDISFSITAKHDPNIFFSKLTVDSKSCITKGFEILPFHYSFETDGDDISIFTAKLFDKYIYEKVV